jgi:NAD(P)-dependent dehydrogenase (short-subunit alcohol dehydrogenase family)
VQRATSADALELAGRVALVTGGSRGIGRAIALELGRCGASVAIAARTAAELSSTLTEILSSGGTGAAIAADLADGAEAARVVAETERRLGQVDILINNAGVGSAIDPRPVVDFSDATWDLTLALNLTAPYILCKAVLPGMLVKRWGRIVNIASIVAKVGAYRGSAYAASKGGLVSFTKSLALEVAKDGITANAICPGPVRTATSDKRLTQISAERNIPFSDLETSLTPMGRRLDPSEIAHAVAFLVSERAAGITGQAWNVDAGAVLS